MKICEQILKKRQRPNTIQILWIVKKNQEHRNIATLSLQLRSYKKTAPIQSNSWIVKKGERQNNSRWEAGGDF